MQFWVLARNEITLNVGISFFLCVFAAHKENVVTLLAVFASQLRTNLKSLHLVEIITRKL
jgi:hypothetical protein